MGFFSGIDDALENTRQALSAMALQKPLTSVDDKLGIASKFPEHGPYVALVPDHDPAPRPARRLYRVSHTRELTPVREDEKRRAFFCDAPALAKPLCHPPCERALILGVAEHRRIGLFRSCLLVFCGWSCLLAGECGRSATIRRIGNDGINRVGWKQREDSKSVTLINCKRIILKKRNHGKAFEEARGHLYRGAWPSHG